MQNRFIASIRRNVVFVMFAGLLAVGSTGCKDEPKPAAPPAPVAAPAVPMKAYTLEGIMFQYPADWKVEEMPDKKAVSIVAPTTDGGWPPGVYLAVTGNQRGEDPDALMDALLDVLRRKEGFELKAKETLDHPSGFKYIRVDYTNTEEYSSTNIPLRQLSAQVLLPGKKRLEIQAGSAKDVWERFQPKFDQIIASVKLPK